MEEASADVGASGAITVPAHVLHDIVRKLADGSQVEIKREGDNDRVTITSGQSIFALQSAATRRLSRFGCW